MEGDELSVLLTLPSGSLPALTLSLKYFIIKKKKKHLGGPKVNRRRLVRMVLIHSTRIY